MGCLRNLKIEDSKSVAQSSFPRPATVRSGWRLLALALASMLTFTGTTQAQENPDGYYVGVFSGPGVLDVQTTDLDGFTGSQGIPGQTFEYDDTGFPTGVVAGRHFHLGRVPIRFEVDGAFVGLPSASRQMDPVGMDEMASSELRWVATARIGVRKPFGRVGVFLDGGVSVAEVGRGLISRGSTTNPRATPCDCC